MNSLFKEDELLDLIHDQKTCLKLIEDRYNRKSTNYIKLDALELFIINNYDKEEYTSLINKYILFLIEQIKKNPNIIFDSKLCNSNYINEIFNNEQRRIILNHKHKTHLKTMHSFNTLKDGKKLGDDYLRYAISLIGKHSSFLNNTYKYLLNNIKYNNSYLAYEFIVKYSAFLSAKELKIKDSNIYLTNYDNIKGIYLDCFGKSYPSSNTILINRDKIKDKDALIQVIQTVAHEMKHLYQFNKFKKKEATPLYFDVLLYHLLANYDEDEINKNYDNFKVEKDANNYGWDFVARVFSAYTKNYNYIKYSLKRKNEELLNQLVGYKNNNHFLVEDFNYKVNMFSKMIKKDPTILDNHQLLGYIFDREGNLLSFEKLLFYERILYVNDRLKYSNIDKCFKDFYMYHIDKGINISTKNMNHSLKISLFEKLIDLAINELEDLEKIKKLVEIKTPYTHKTKSMIKNKLRRVRNIINYLDKHSVLISRLNNYMINLKTDKMIFLINKLDLDITKDIISNYIYRKNTYDIQHSGYKLQKSLK